MTKKIVVDVMGGDKGPGIIIAGAIMSLEKISDDIILIGNESIIKDELDKLNLSFQKLKRIEIVHASQEVIMEDSPVLSLRKKPDSSIAKGLELVRNEKASAFISPGNTGAVMVAAIRILGLLKGLERPGIVTILPNNKELGTVVIDSGANIDCKPKHLAQFAVIGSIFYKNILDTELPKVGLLSVGAERSKGNEQVKAAYSLIEKLDLNFIGNIEGKDIFKGSVDVVVCDGFVGNIVLKLSEQIALTIAQNLKSYLKSSFRSKIGALLIKPELKKLKKKISYDEYGGAPLLGVAGCCIICHGSSNSKAIMNAIILSGKYIKKNINHKITTHLSSSII